MKTGLKKVQVDALFEALCEKGFTPYFVVDANHPDAIIPSGYASESGVITLNLSRNSVRNFGYDDKGYVYSASFGGKPYTVSIPYGAIIGIYPHENLDYAFRFDPLYPDVPVTEPSAPEPSAPGPTKNDKAHVGWHKSATVH